MNVARDEFLSTGQRVRDMQVEDEAFSSEGERE
jgi:hypothetical protein